jgi:hypothetical protein
MATDDSDDPKVKDLLDPATEADLMRWFSLPSFQQLAEPPKPKQVVDEEMQAVIARRDKALAAVDPAFVARLRERTEDRTAALIRFEAKIDVHVDDELGLFDERMVERACAIAEPREVEIPDELSDHLKECTPQALLRDLHRAELYFDKTFEIVDVAADQRFDIVSEIATAMATSWKLPPLSRSPARESAEILAGARAQRRRPWTELLPALPNRRVAE